MYYHSCSSFVIQKRLTTILANFNGNRCLLVVVVYCQSVRYSRLRYIGQADSKIFLSAGMMVFRKSRSLDYKFPVVSRTWILLDRVHFLNFVCYRLVVRCCICVGFFPVCSISFYFHWCHFEQIMPPKFHMFSRLLRSYLLQYPFR